GRSPSTGSLPLTPSRRHGTPTRAHRVPGLPHIGSHEPPQASGTDDPRGDRRATVRNLTPAAVEAGKRGNFGSQTGKGRYSRPGSVAPTGARTRDTGPG